MGLPYGKEIMIVGRTMWTVHKCDRRTDDRRTDRRTDKITITKTVQRIASHGKNKWVSPVEAIQYYFQSSKFKILKFTQQAHFLNRLSHWFHMTQEGRAVAAQTTWSCCKFRYALFRDYRHTQASRVLESESVDSSIKTVIHATWNELMDAFSVWHATISITKAGPRPLFPADSKRLQYTITQLNCKRWYCSKDILLHRFCY